MIEVNSGDGGGVWIVERRRAVNAGVSADVMAVPVSGEALGIICDCMFESLKSYECIEESRVWN